MIRSGRVRDAFSAVPRELFVADFAEQSGLEAVYEDEAIVTRQDAQGLPLSSSSQPAIVALMLEKLDVEAGMSVLEVGAGTGYNAALLSLLVGPRGRVVSIDLDADTAAGADRALHGGGYRAQVVTGDGRDGFADGAPYDRIVATASSDSVPFAWFEQLKPGGLLELPLRVSVTGVQVIPVLLREDRGFRSTAVICGGFMPLRQAGENAAASVPPALRVADVAGGKAQPIRELYGQSLATLGPRAKRRLLSVALEDGRLQRLGLRAAPERSPSSSASRCPSRGRCRRCRGSASARSRETVRASPWSRSPDAAGRSTRFACSGAKALRNAFCSRCGSGIDVVVRRSRTSPSRCATTKEAGRAYAVAGAVSSWRRGRRGSHRASARRLPRKRRCLRYGRRSGRE